MMWVLRSMMRFGLILAGFLAAVGLASCAHEPAAQEGFIVTATRQPTERPPVLVSATVPVMGTDVSSPVPGSEVCQTDTDGRAVCYDIQAALDWALHTVTVEQHVRYRNTTGRDLGTLVFNIEPNREPGQFTLGRVTVGEAQMAQKYDLEGARLSLDLPAPLAPECETEITLAYTLTLPPVYDGYSQGQGGYRLGYWGYTSRQINLGMWFPMLAVFDSSGEWVTPGYHSIGEQAVNQSADFAVTLRVEGVPGEVKVAGPGVMTQPDADTWHFELAGGREIALSVLLQYEVMSTTTTSGVEVSLYYFPQPDSTDLDAERLALHTAADALSLFEDLYGPYPLPRLVVVQGDFPDGMEFSGLVFVSEDWFLAWKKKPHDWLTIITAHEVSHQWWYLLVGNDQGIHPYLDEALAVYSEALFFEHIYPQHLDWWWNFRIERYAPDGYVDTPVYDFYSVRGYINTVYLRGAQMIDALRRGLGDEVFFSRLRQYAQEKREQIAIPLDFWNAMGGADNAVIKPICTAYLRQPNILAWPADIP